MSIIKKWQTIEWLRQNFFIHLPAYKNHARSKEAEKSGMTTLTITHTRSYLQTHIYFQVVPVKSKNYYLYNCFIIKRFKTVTFNIFCNIKTSSNSRWAYFHYCSLWCYHKAIRYERKKTWIAGKINTEKNWVNYILFLLHPFSARSFFSPFS